MIYAINQKKYYIGASTNLKRRFSEHKRDLLAKKHKNLELQKIWDEEFSQKSPVIQMDEFFPSNDQYEKCEKCKDTAKFIFMELLSVKFPTQDLRKDMKEELLLYEEAVTDIMADCVKSFGGTEKPAVNIFLTLGTDNRESIPVCIDGVFYKSRSVAAAELGLYKASKPNKQTVSNRLETLRWSTWCFVQDNKLIKRIRKMDPTGRRTGYEVWQYGEVIYTADNVKTAFYWSTPERLSDEDRPSTD